jgi:uncharacterized membrane protein YqaE (UPF0057 family)
MQLELAKWLKYLRQDWRYELAIYVFCSLAAVFFRAGVNRGHEWIGLIIAALIYVPGTVFVNTLRARKHERERNLIASALR